MRRISFFLFIIIIHCSLHAQQSFTCGTVVTAQQIKDELNFNKAASTVPDQCLKKEVSIYAYIVKDSTGQPNLTSANINAGITVVNQYFAPICLSFKICKIIYIDNWKYDLFHDKKEENEVKNLYFTSNVINMFFVQTIQSPAGAAGYAPIGNALPNLPTKDIIVISKASVAAGLVMTHELGHFLGLYHTFEWQAFGYELVDESNCASAGDRICDTEADVDPGMSSIPCPYTGAFKDVKGNFYTPPVGNIMAYHTCKCKFTTEQYNRMAFCFLNFRKYLL